MNQLASLVQRLSVNDVAAKPATGKAARRRRQRQRRRNAGAVSVGGADRSLLPAGQPGMTRTTAPRRQTKIAGSEGQMRVSRDELFLSVVSSEVGDVKLSVPLNPAVSKDSFPWLSGLATSWERIVWHKLQFSWRPALGTTADGIVAYAVTWEPKDKKFAPDRSYVTSQTPVKDHAVWQATDTAPYIAKVSLLQSRKHYLLSSSSLEDAAPGSLVINVKGVANNKFLGELWARYDVSMMGPKPA